MEQKHESLPESLMESVTNDYSTDALIDFSESVLDSVTEAILTSDLMQDIPLLKSVIGIVKAGIGFRDRRYVSKLAALLSETSKASDEDRRRYREKLEKDPEESRRAGETILDIVDKITSKEKVRMVGKVVRAAMHEDDISFKETVYLCEIIERTYLQDLVSLQSGEMRNDANLENVGIMKPIRVEDINEVFEKGLNQAVETATSRSGVVKETFSFEPTESKEVIARVRQSGLTEAGYQLTRILGSYK